MKNSYKAALLAVLGLTVASAAQAQTAGSGDLVLGFVGASASQDYVLDFGSVANLTANETLATIDLSSSSTFNSVFGTENLSGISAGLVVGYNDGTSLDTTVLDNGTGTATTAGSSAPHAPNSKNYVGNATGDVPLLTLGTPLKSLSTSFSSDIAANPTDISSGAFVAALGGDNPLNTIGSANSIVLDLWSITENSGHTAGVTESYVGDITITENGSSATVVYDAAAASVPEPTTYGLLAGAGLLIVSLRNKFSRKNA